MNQTEVLHSIKKYLSDRHISCEMVVEDQWTSFWSYQIPAHNLWGWISLHTGEETRILASITFGVLAKNFDGQALVIFLEESSWQEDGLSFATQANSLVAIQFNMDFQFLTRRHLLFLLQRVHDEAPQCALRFASGGFGIEPLPDFWFDLEAG